MQPIMLVIAATGFSFAAVAQTQTPLPTNAQPLYAQMGYGFLTQTVKVGNVSVNSDMEQVTATIGYRIHSRLAVEGMMGVGVSDKKGTASGNLSYNTKINNMFGLFIKPHITITDQLSVHARIGYTQAAQMVTVSTNPQSRLSYTSSGLTYGLGANYAVTPNLNVLVDYYVFGNDLSGNSSISQPGEFKGLHVGVEYAY